MGIIAGLRRAMGVMIAVSMGMTGAVLLLEGRWREAVPLHLCSVCALAAAALALRPRAYLLDLLWYLGMPGSALALLFPAPATSRFQLLMNASYTATHLLIIAIPVSQIAEGMRPRRGLALRMMIVLQGIALCAAGANALLGTDFLFLAAPPAGTPLEALFALGYAPYLFALEALAALMCAGMERLNDRFFANKRPGE